MAKIPSMVDLCCGLGGANAAMRDRGWIVITVDIAGDVKPDIVADVRSLGAHQLTMDLLWASPPCEQFTRAALPWKVRKLGTIEPDLSVVRAVRRLIDDWSPRFWIVENTIWSRKYLTPIFGPVRVQTAGHCFWSNLPLLLPDVPKNKGSIGQRRGSERARHLQRSLIPYAISEAVAIAVEREIGWKRSESRAAATNPNLRKLGGQKSLP